MVSWESCNWAVLFKATQDDLRREIDHFALGDVLLNTRLKRGSAIIDGDFFAIRSSASGVF
jgi:hypothetical protein